jgi:hypothetical protein
MQNERAVLAVAGLVLIFALVRSANAADQGCGKLESLLGEWTWQTEAATPKSPSGTFSFARDLKGALILGRGSRTFPPDRSVSSELFVVYAGSDKRINQVMYFDDAGRAAHCSVELSSTKCTIDFTCRSEGVHERYVFFLPENGQARFQWQVPPPHHHGEFVPYLSGVLKKQERRPQ